jgi:hypothetical protein
MKNVLTPDIVREELEKDGIIFGLRDEDAAEKLLEYFENDFGSTIDYESSWAKGHEGLLIYTQSTADSYDLYVCTNTHGNDIYWDSDVFYYEDHNTFSERAIEQLASGSDVWVDPSIWDEMEYEFNAHCTDAYEDYYSELFDDKKEQLLESGKYDRYED